MTNFFIFRCRYGLHGSAFFWKRITEIDSNVLISVVYFCRTLKNRHQRLIRHPLSMESNEGEEFEWNTYPSFDPSREDVNRTLTAAGRILESGQDEYDPR